MTAPIRVIGVGQHYRGDDAAGLAVAARLQGSAGLDVHVGVPDAAWLLAQIEDQPCAIVIDCVRGGGAPGSILRLDAAAAAHLRTASTTSHGNALAEALALGTALGCLPTRLVIFGIVGDRFALGDAMSPAVVAEIPALVDLVRAEALSPPP